MGFHENEYNRFNLDGRMRKNIPCVLLSIAFHSAALILCCSCSQSSPTISEPFPHYLTEDDDWITYEGTLPSESGQTVTVELQLVPGTPGMDSYYRIEETFHAFDSTMPFSGFSRSQGRYSVLVGSPGHNIIQIISKRKMRSVTGKGFTKADEVTENLYLKSYGDHELVLVDEDFNEAVPRHSLIRRSELFTVEGYFTVYGDTTEFFERNTRKTWPVAQLAHYDEAVRKYDRLAKEKFEGVYLKALSYSITQTDKNGKESDALVFKKILLMDSMPSNNF